MSFIQSYLSNKPKQCILTIFIIFFVITLLHCSCVAILNFETAPTKMEIKNLTNGTERMNEKQLSLLGAAEKFHRAMNKIVRFREKVSCFLFKSGFDETCDRLDDQISNLTNAITDVLNCSGLTKVLETVLSVGNLMNKGTHAGEAKGITLDSLLKLTSTKSNDNKTTVLDYVVQTMLSSETKKKYTNFPNELLKLKDATKCNMNVLTSNLKALEKGVVMMKKEAKEDNKANNNGAGNEEEGDDAFQPTKFAKVITKFLNKKGETKINQYRSQLRVCEDRSALLRDHFGEDPKCDVVHLFDVLDKFSTAFSTSVKKTNDREARKRRMSQQSEKRGRARRASRSPERNVGGKEGEGKEGGSSPDAGQKKRGNLPKIRRGRSSRSPGRRSRGSSVEGKRGDSGGPNLLAAIMAKGGIGGLKNSIKMKQSASPGTKQKHEQQENLMAMLLQMGHDREEVKEIAIKIMKNKSIEQINSMMDRGEKGINKTLDLLNIPKIMSASEKRVEMLNAMMKGRK